MQAKYFFIAIAFLALAECIFAASISEIIINNGDKYTNQPRLSLEIIAYAEEMRFSCNALQWTAWTAFSERHNFELRQQFGCTLEDGNKEVFVQVRDANETDLGSQWIFLDNTPPTQPSNLTADYDGRKISISWSASSDESGIEKYLIRVKEQWKEEREFSEEVGGNVVSWSHFARERAKYCYSVRAMDKAGNYSVYSEEKCKSTALEPPEFTVSISDKNGLSREFNEMIYFREETILIEVRAVDELKAVKGRVVQGEQAEEIEFEKENEVYLAEYNVKAVDGDGLVEVKVEDFLDWEAEKKVFFVAITTAPEMEIIETRQLSEEKLLLKGSVSSNSSELKIEFNGKVFEKDLNGKKDFQAELEISEITSEILEIRFALTDFAGNKTTKSINVTLLLDLDARMADIKILKEAVEQSLRETEQIILFKQPEIEEGLLNSEELIQKIRENAEAENYNRARENLQKAKLLLDQLKRDSVRIRELKRYTVDYGSEKPVFFRELAAYFERVPEKTEELWESLEIFRETTVFEISGEREKYRASVVLRIKNTEQVTEPFWLIEKVPESISENLRVIESNTLFELQENTIAIPVRGLRKGEEIEIRYAGPVLSKEEFQALEISLGDFFVPVPVEDKKIQVNFARIYKPPNLLPVIIILILISAGYWAHRRIKR